MESNINGAILLVGEGNFSFTLSLIDYCEPRLVTTTCYETKEALYGKYGQSLIDSNIELMHKSNVHRVMFGVDATRLDDYFARNEFDRVVFMFPHVGGKSNLKKNRQLVELFFKSCHLVLKRTDLTCNRFDLFASDGPLGSSAVYIGLAAGQGGTRFEKDPAKRNNKDSWIVNQLAQQCGLILTDCSPFQSHKFLLYQSSGFRSQSKSFCTDSSLVHKFEFSLPLELNLTENFNWLQWEFDRLETFFNRNETNMDKTDVFKHPLVQLKYSLGRLCNDLVEDKQGRLTMDNTDSEELTYFDYEIVLCCRVDSDVLVQRLKSIIEVNFLLNELTDDESSQKRKFYSRDENEAGRLVIFEIEDAKSRKDGVTWCKVNGVNLLRRLFGLNDGRLIFTNDRRAFTRISNGNLVEWSIRPYVVETNVWCHDVSFWCERESFDYSRFIHAVKDNCFGLVRNVKLMDDYWDEKKGRFSMCYRLAYESCDRALDWNTTVLIQNNLRRKLEKEYNFLVR